MRFINWLADRESILPLFAFWIPFLYLLVMAVMSFLLRELPTDPITIRAMLLAFIVCLGIYSWYKIEVEK
jgi:hypothetical protein